MASTAPLKSSDDSQQVHAPNTVAPFKERESGDGSRSGASPAAKNQHGRVINAASALKQQQEKLQQLQPAVTQVNSRRQCKQAFQPISAVRAAAKVAVAEAAVSAATAAFVPAARVQRTIRSSSGGGGNTKLPGLQQKQHQKQQPPNLEMCSNAQEVDATIKALLAREACLQVHGTCPGPQTSSTGSTLRAASAQAAAYMGSISGSLPGTVRISLAGAAAVEQAPEQGQVQPPSTSGQQMLQTLPLNYQQCAGVEAVAKPPQPLPAAAQLAAYGVNKRIRAQLRSAHGPPPFQRTAPPRPASPPPVVLDIAMLAEACLSDAAPGAAANPADAAVADLSSRNISCIDLDRDTDSSSSCAAGLPAEPQVDLTGSQQLCLQSFAQLVSLDLNDNRLECFAGLAVLPSLQQLNMSANRLRNLQRLLPSSVSTVWQCTDARSSSSSSSSRKGTADAKLVACSSDQQVQQEGTCSGWDQELGGCGEQTDGQSSSRHSADGVQETAAAAAPDDQERPVAGQLEAAGPDEQQLLLEQAAQDAQEPGLSQRHQQQQGCEQQDWEEQQCEFPGIADTGTGAVVQPPSRLHGFQNLQVLDVSYNMLSGEELLGTASPLGQLPRFYELHAAGNSMSALPAQLAPFSSLTLLNLQHNQLQLCAVAPLAALPALHHLDLSYNPLQGPAHCTYTAQAASCTEGSATGQEHRGFAQLQVLDLSSSRVKQLQPLQELLGCMQALTVLRLLNTPLAERCRAGRVPEQELQRPGLTLLLAAKPSRHTAQHSRASGAAAVDRGAVLKIPEVATPSKVLAAAAKSALASLPHEQLVAAFDRVSAGIDTWQQLAPVLEEEGSWEWQGDGSNARECRDGQQQEQVGAKSGPQRAGAPDERIEDNTFLTGVGIMGELPGEGEAAPDAASSQVGSSDQAEAWQDPTERLALALGLQVAQLAHYTGRVPGNPDGALHMLRHALAHPLVDPDAGQRPQQHHMRTTAATAAKASAARLMPLPQPISTALGTQVQPVPDLLGQLKSMRGRLTAMQGTLLPQLQGQANRMTAGSGKGAGAGPDAGQGRTGR